MDDLHFDTLARGLASRRRLLTGLASLPVLGGLLGLLDADDAAAGGRHKRRKKRHKHGSGRRRRKNTHKQKNRCTPECAGTCGGASNGCGGTCSACPAGQVCAGTSCQVCDVCASGCAHATIVAAIAAASAGDTIRLCAGTYALAAHETIVIDKPLTIIGAGAGQSGSIIDGQKLARATAVLATLPVGPIELRNLTVTGGNRTGGANPDWGGGIQNFGGLSLAGVRVTENQAAAGGGLWNADDGWLTLNAGTAVTHNSSTVGGGGGIANFGVLALNAGSSVTDNEAAATGATGGGIRMFGGRLTIETGVTLANNEPDDCSGTGCPT